MRNQTAADFDFEDAGYQGPAEWARLHDLITANTTKDQRAALEKNDTKANVCALLTIHGIEFNRAFDAMAAAKRNASR